MDDKRFQVGDNRFQMGDNRFMVGDNRMDDNRFMAAALEQARIARDKGEVPIGAVVVCGDRIVATGHNMTETLGDPTAHAEMIALTAATNTIGGKYLNDCSLYVTVEPCPMCAAALGWAQLGRLVYGAADPKRGYSLFRMLAAPGHSMQRPQGRTSERGLDVQDRALERGMDAQGQVSERGLDVQGRASERGMNAQGRASERGLDVQDRALERGMDAQGQTSERRMLQPQGHVSERGLLHPKTVVLGGVMSQECSRLMTDFFAQKR